MELVNASDIREFRIRGNYFNQRSLIARRALHSQKKGNIPPCPGYSPPAVEYVLTNGASGILATSDADMPSLCDADVERAKRHLSLILNARRGDAQAVRDLSGTADFLSRGAEPTLPAETSFVVPSTSCDPHSENDISQKGYILLKLSQMGYPVPDFTVLTTQAYADRELHLEQHVEEAIRQLEILTLQRVDDSISPLVFAIRCATASYIPGLMDTFLNVGVTESTLPGLEKMYGAEPARKMFLNNLRNLCLGLGEKEHDPILNAVRSDLPPEEVTRLTDQLCAIIRKTDPGLIENSFCQASFFVRQVYKHFEENRELVLALCRGAEHHPSVIMQKMICTVRHDNACAGVLSSRHTQTGIGIELQTAHNIFGEEIMTGTAQTQSTVFKNREEIKERFPAVYHFIPHLSDLEREFESPVTIEFAVEATERHQLFALLQLNETGMAGRAAIASAVDMHKAGIISRERVSDLVRPYHIKQFTGDTIEEKDLKELTCFCPGVSVLPRVAVSARVYFTEDVAIRAKMSGEPVCLCKRTFLPTDSAVMREMNAIISLTSAAIHVITICHSLGVPALLNMEKSGVQLQPGGGLVNASGLEIKEGDWVTVSSRKSALYLGKAKFTPCRLLRFMKGEPLDVTEREKDTLITIAYAYRYYQQLTRGAGASRISTLGEVIRLVNFELRGEPEEARHLVNSWFDNHEAIYLEGVLKSDIGDHLGQSNVFEMLTLERKIRFFQQAVAKCFEERLCGYEAGAFMLGRFLCVPYPVAFWKAFTPQEIGMLVNEWVLFEKYMQMLHSVGERKLFLARKQILMGGLDQLSLHPGYLRCLITLKLSGAELEEARYSLPEWSDPQSTKALELLQQPYRAFYDFQARWSISQLEKICGEEHLPLPLPDDK